MSQCLQTLESLTTKHRNVFPELAVAHPSYASFLETTLGINLLGSREPDEDEPERVHVLERMRHPTYWGPRPEDEPKPPSWLPEA